MAIRVEPESLLAHNYLGLVLHATGDLKDSASAFREALRRDPSNADAHAHFGRTLAVSGQREDAIEHYRQAIRLRPDWPLPYNNLAWTLATDSDVQRRDPNEALALVKQAIRLAGRPSPSTLDTLAAAQAASGDFEQAVVTAQNAIELARKAGAEELARNIRLRLQLYQEQSPFLDVP